MGLLSVCASIAVQYFLPVRYIVQIAQIFLPSLINFYDTSN